MTQNRPTFETLREQLGEPRVRPAPALISIVDKLIKQLRPAEVQTIDEHPFEEQRYVTDWCEQLHAALRRKGIVLRPGPKNFWSVPNWFEQALIEYSKEYPDEEGQSGDFDETEVPRRSFYMPDDFDDDESSHGTTVSKNERDDRVLEDHLHYWVRNEQRLRDFLVHQQHELWYYIQPEGKGCRPIYAMLKFYRYFFFSRGFEKLTDYNPHTERLRRMRDRYVAEFRLRHQEPEMSPQRVLLSFTDVALHICCVDMSSGSSENVPIPVLESAPTASDFMRLEQWYLNAAKSHKPYEDPVKAVKKEPCAAEEATKNMQQLPTMRNNETYDQIKRDAAAQADKWFQRDSEHWRQKAHEVIQACLSSDLLRDIQGDPDVKSGTWKMPMFTDEGRALQAYYLSLIILHDLAGGYVNISHGMWPAGGIPVANADGGILEQESKVKLCLWDAARHVFNPFYGDKSDFIKAALRAVKTDLPTHRIAVQRGNEQKRVEADLKAEPCSSVVDAEKAEPLRQTVEKLRAFAVGEWIGKELSATDCVTVYNQLMACIAPSFAFSVQQLAKRGYALAADNLRNRQHELFDKARTRYLPAEQGVKVLFPDNLRVEILSFAEEIERTIAGVTMPPAKGTKKQDYEHNADFTMVTWFGTEYKFSPEIQAKAVAALWQEWEKTRLGLHQKTVGQKAGSAADAGTFRMDTLFRNHPAFGTMICAEGDGIYRLTPPNSKRNHSKKSRKR